MVAAADPGTSVGGGEQRGSLGWGEETDQGGIGPLAGDGEHPAGQRGVLGAAQRCVGEQRVDSSEPVVSGSDAVAPLGIQVTEERADERRVQVGEVQPGRRLAQTFERVTQQQAEGVPVRGNCVRAGPALRQPLGEERLQDRRERGHSLSPGKHSRRAAAAVSNSGAACRYQ